MGVRSARLPSVNLRDLRNMCEGEGEGDTPVATVNGYEVWRIVMVNDGGFAVVPTTSAPTAPMTFIFPDTREAFDAALLEAADLAWIANSTTT